MAISVSSNFSLFDLATKPLKIGFKKFNSIMTLTKDIQIDCARFRFIYTRVDRHVACCPSFERVTCIQLTVFQWVTILCIKSFFFIKVTNSLINSNFMFSHISPVQSHIAGLDHYSRPIIISSSRFLNESSDGAFFLPSGVSSISVWPDMRRKICAVFSHSLPILSPNDFRSARRYLARPRPRQVWARGGPRPASGAEQGRQREQL